MMNYLTVRGTEQDLINLMEIFKISEERVESTEMFPDGMVEAVLSVEGELSEIEDIIEIKHIH